MKYSKALNLQRWRRTNRVRKNIRGDAERPRLTVFRSHKHIYCQIIDDQAGKTLVSASTRDKDLKGSIQFGGNVDAAKQIGQVIGEKAKAAGITAIRFDRGRYQFHGRVAGIAEGARDAGLEF